MSRAFITDKEDWTYCPKAGERCMHAEEGKVCKETDCEHFDKAQKQTSPAAASMKVVQRKTKEAKATKPSSSKPARPTKKSKLKKPKKWGGRSTFWTL